MEKWYNQQHWLIQGFIRSLLYTSLFYLLDVVFTNYIGWFEQDGALKKTLFEAMWKGVCASIVFPLNRLGRFYKKLTTNQDESAGN